MAPASCPSRPSAPVQKTLPDDRCVPEELLLAVREPVEPCGDDALERLRERELVGGSALEVELRELLRVEGVAARPLEQRLLRVGGEHGLLEDAAR